MKSYQLFSRQLLLAALFSLTTAAAAYYNPQTGRWLSRDPIAERGGVNLYEFALNTPISRFDVLGRSTATGVQDCTGACDHYKKQRLEENDGYIPPGGAVLCCGGSKYICTWGADDIADSTVKSIVIRCLRAHENTHVRQTKPCGCANGIKSAEFKDGVRKRNAEIEGNTVGRDCFKAALSECGGNQACIDAINGWIQHEQDQINYYQSLP